MWLRIVPLIEVKSPPKRISPLVWVASVWTVAEGVGVPVIIVPSALKKASLARAEPFIMLKVPPAITRPAASRLTQRPSESKPAPGLKLRFVAPLELSRAMRFGIMV